MFARQSCLNQKEIHLELSNIRNSVNNVAMEQFLKKKRKKQREKETNEIKLVILIDKQSLHHGIYMCARARARAHMCVCVFTRTKEIA